MDEKKQFVEPKVVKGEKSLDKVTLSYNGYPHKGNGNPHKGDGDGLNWWEWILERF